MPSDLQPPLAAEAVGLLLGERRQAGGVHPLGQVPDALRSAPAGDRDLAAHQQELEHLGDVAVVRPAGRLPGHLGGVRDVARDERAGIAEPFQDIAPEFVIGGDPFARPLVSVPAGRWVPVVQRQVLDGPNHGVELEQGPIHLQRLPELLRVIGRSQPAPGHQVGVGRHGRGGIDLEQGQLADDRVEVRRAGSIQELGPDGDPPCIGQAQLVDGHDRSLPCTTKNQRRHHSCRRSGSATRMRIRRSMLRSVARLSRQRPPGSSQPSVLAAVVVAKLSHFARSLDLGADAIGHGLGELHVVVEGVHSKFAALAVGGDIGLPRSARPRGGSAARK